MSDTGDGGSLAHCAYLVQLLREAAAQLEQEQSFMSVEHNQKWRVVEVPCPDDDPNCRVVHRKWFPGMAELKLNIVFSSTP